jgi:hypothetical protein
VDASPKPLSFPYDRKLMEFVTLRVTRSKVQIDVRGSHLPHTDEPPLEHRPGTRGLRPDSPDTSYWAGEYGGGAMTGNAPGGEGSLMIT